MDKRKRGRPLTKYQPPKDAFNRLRKLLLAYNSEDFEAKGDVLYYFNTIGPIKDRQEFVNFFWHGKDRFHDGVWDGLETFFNELRNEAPNH
jgi:hypothetical protein